MNGGFERWVVPGGWADRATRWVAFIGLIGLLIITGFILVDIVLRAVFNSPIDGLEDIAKFTFGVGVAACFPAGLIQGHNVAIRFLGKAVGRKRTTWLEAFGALCTMAFFFLIAWRFVVFTVDEIMHHRYTPTLHIVTGPFWSLIAVIVCLTVPVQIVVLALWLKRMIRREPAPESSGGGELA
jgi:TRAP-type C4-dicarboxylate transport system permease small subunit